MKLQSKMEKIGSIDFKKKSHFLCTRITTTKKVYTWENEHKIGCQWTMFDTLYSCVSACVCAVYVCVWVEYTIKAFWELCKTQRRW